MAFFVAFLQAVIVIFAFPLVGSWVTNLIGEPSGSNYKDKGHNILTFVIFVALVLGVLWVCQEINNPFFGLLPASLLIVSAAALRLNYEKDYELSWFLKSFSIKICLSIFAAFMMSSGK